MPSFPSPPQPPSSPFVPYGQELAELDNNKPPAHNQTYLEVEGLLLQAGLGNVLSELAVDTNSPTGDGRVTMFVASDKSLHSIAKSFVAPDNSESEALAWMLLGTYAGMREILMSLILDGDTKVDEFADTIITYPTRNRDVQLSVVVKNRTVTEIALDNVSGSRRRLLSDMSRSRVSGKYVSPNGHIFYYLTDAPISSSVVERIQRIITQATLPSQPPLPAPASTALQGVQSDVIPPQLALREPFRAALTLADPLDPSVLLDAVETRVVVVGEFDAKWVDTGADASDDVDAASDVTLYTQLLQHQSGSLVVLEESGGGGLVSIDISSPSPSDAPFLILYMAWDVAGNAAAPKVRVVHVVCAEDEELCTKSTGELGCTVEGVCLGPGAASSKFPIITGSQGPLVSPVLELLGPSRVELMQGQAYDRCLPMAAAADLVCDRGAQTIDPSLCDLKIMVTCTFQPALGSKEPEPRQPSIPFNPDGLQKCGLNTSHGIGTWFIDFQVQSREGLTSALVTRRLKVIEACLAGQITCDTGLCADNLSACELGQIHQDIELIAPNITLKEVPGADPTSAVVSVEQFKPYMSCLDFESGPLCEPGANATESPTPGHVRDISSKVLACPPDSCLEEPSSCEERFRFSANGIAGCGVNTSAEVGTVFTLRFVVVSMDGLVAQVERLIQIVDPCNAGSFFCQGQCSEVECDMLAGLNLPPPPGPPKFSVNISSPVSPDGGRRRALLQQTGNRASSGPLQVSLAYGFPAESLALHGTGWFNPFLSPCPQQGGNGCGSIARDFLGNPVGMTTSTVCTASLDSSSSWEEWRADAVRLAESNRASTCSEPVTCTMLSADRGQCPPGNYAFKLEAADSVNRVETELLLVRVEAAARHRLYLRVAMACDSPQELQEKVTDMGVEVPLHYLPALGLRAPHLKQVSFVEPMTVLPGIAHAGIPAHNMPQLCYVEMTLEVQVGCTSEEQGFQAGPQGAETDEQWCPCSVPWNPAYKDVPFFMHPGTVYPVDQGLYSSLIVLELRHPEGSNPSGPSPFCMSITKPSDSKAALMWHAAGQLSNMESVAQSLIVLLAQTRIKIATNADDVVKLDTSIETKWALLLDEFEAKFSRRLVPRMTALSLEGPNPDARFSVLGGLAWGVTIKPLIDDGGRRYSRLDVQAVDSLPPDVLDMSGAAPKVRECVETERGGAEAHFSFRVGLQPASDELLSNMPGNTDDGEMLDLNGYRVPRKLLGNKMQRIMQVSAPKTVSQMGAADANYFNSAAKRLVGLSTNQVLTGALIVQTRHPLRSLAVGGSKYARACQPGGFARDLAAECDELRTRLAAQRASKAASMQGQGAPTGALHIGVDPAFISSAPLFNPQVAFFPQGWYNTSSAEQVNQEGIPMGFAPRSVPGLPDDSYPLVLDINLDGKWAHRLMQHLLQGAYLDRFATDTLQVKVGTYSVNMQLYGYSVATARWDNGGQIHLKWKVETLEFRDYSSEGLKAPGMVRRLATDLVLLVLILIYPFLVFRDIRHSTLAQKRRARIWHELHRARRAMEALQETHGPDGLGSRQLSALAADNNVLRMVESRLMSQKPTASDPQHTNPCSGPSQPGIEAGDARSSQLLSAFHQPLPPSQHPESLQHHASCHVQASPFLGASGSTSQLRTSAHEQVPWARSPTSPSSLVCVQQLEGASMDAASGGPAGKPPAGPVAESFCSSTPSSWIGLQPRRAQVQPAQYELATAGKQQTAAHARCASRSLNCPSWGHAQQHGSSAPGLFLQAQQGQPSLQSLHSSSGRSSECERSHLQLLHFGPGPVAEATLEPESNATSGSADLGSRQQMAGLSSTVGVRGSLARVRFSVMEGGGSFRESNALGSSPSFARGRSGLREGGSNFRKGGAFGPSGSFARGRAGFSEGGSSFKRGTFTGGQSDDDSSSAASESSVILDYDDTVVDDHPILGPSIEGRKIKIKRIKNFQPPASFMQEATVTVSVAAADKEGEGPDACSDEWTDNEGNHVHGGREYGMKKHILTTLPRIYRGTSARWWIPYEIITCVLMVVPAALLFYYTCYLQPHTAPTERRFQVYDSLYSPANPFMLKLKEWEQLPASDMMSVGNPHKRMHRLPGETQRWQVGQEDEEGLRNVAEMYSSLNTMAAVMMAYSLIQGGVLVLIMIRLINLTAFQPLLSIVAGTLAGALEDMIFFAIVISISALMLSMVVVTIFGSSMADVSSTSRAMWGVFTGITQGAATSSALEGRFMDFLAKETQGGFGTNIATIALAWILLYLRPLAYIALLVMITSMLSYPYAELHIGAKGCPSVPKDVRMLIHRYWTRVFHGMPSNLEMDNLMDSFLKLSPKLIPPTLGQCWSQAAAFLQQVKLRSASHTPDLPGSPGSPGSPGLSPRASVALDNAKNSKAGVWMSGQRIDDHKLEDLLQHLVPRTSSKGAKQAQADPHKPSSCSASRASAAAGPAVQPPHSWLDGHRKQSTMLQIMGSLRAHAHKHGHKAAEAAAGQHDEDIECGPALTAEEEANHIVHLATDRLMQVLQARHAVHTAKLSKHRQEMQWQATHRLFGTAGAMLVSSYKTSAHIQGARQAALEAVPEDEPVTHAGGHGAGSRADEFAAHLASHKDDAVDPKAADKKGDRRPRKEIKEMLPPGPSYMLPFPPTCTSSSPSASDRATHPKQSLSLAQIGSGLPQQAAPDSRLTKERAIASAAAAAPSGPQRPSGGRIQIPPSPILVPTLSFSDRVKCRDPVQTLLQHWQQAVAGCPSHRDAVKKSDLQLLQEVTALTQQTLEDVAVIRRATQKAHVMAQALLRARNAGAPISLDTLPGLQAVPDGGHDACSASHKPHTSPKQDLTMTRQAPPLHNMKFQSCAPFQRHGSEPVMKDLHALRELRARSQTTPHNLLSCKVDDPDRAPIQPPDQHLLVWLQAVRGAQVDKNNELGLRSTSSLPYSEVSQLGASDTEDGRSDEAEEEEGQPVRTQLQRLADLRAASKMAAALMAMRPGLAVAKAANAEGSTSRPVCPREVPAQQASFAIGMGARAEDSKEVGRGGEPTDSRPGLGSVRDQAGNAHGEHSLAGRAQSFSVSKLDTKGNASMDKSGPVKRRGWRMRRRFMEAHDLAAQEEQSQPAPLAHSFSSQCAKKSFTLRKGSTVVSSDWG